MDDPTQAFLAYAENDRNYSPNTLARFAAVLRDLTVFGDLLTMTPDDIQAWWDSRLFLPLKPGQKTPAKRSPATRANELGCARSFFKWATKKSHRPDDPTRGLDAPNVPNNVPRMVGQSDFDRLLGVLTDDDLDLRRAYALAGYAGLRVSECASLDWADVDYEARRLYVRGKGMKERPVPINTMLWNYLLPELPSGNVVRAGDSPYSGGVLQRKINRHMAHHGINHTMHDLRKRGASIILSKGGNPVAVRIMFGWSSMETVSRYAVVGDSELDRIAEMLI